MPRYLGVILGTKNELVGRLPVKTLCGISFSSAVAVDAVLLEFLADFVGRLALHQRLGLREEIREQDGVVFAERI